MKSLFKKMLMMSAVFVLCALFLHSVKAELVYEDDFNNGSTTTSWSDACVVTSNINPLDGHYMYCNNDVDKKFYTIPTGNSYSVWRLEFYFYDPDDADVLGVVFGCGTGTTHQYVAGVSAQEYQSGKGAYYSVKKGNDYNWVDFSPEAVRDAGWHHVVIIHNGTQGNYTIILDNGAINTKIINGSTACNNIIGYRNSQVTPFRIDSIKLYNDTIGAQAIQSEEAFRNAIEQAANATLTGHLIYTNQQVYSVNSTNSQVLGAFDKFIVWNNKRWAFNYVNSSESFTGMFNLTPVLYVFETTSTTPSALRLSVEKMINSTK